MAFVCINLLINFICGNSNGTTMHAFSSAGYILEWDQDCRRRVRMASGTV